MPEPRCPGSTTRPHDADASTEPGWSRDQKQPCPDGDDPDGSRHALTGRCETFDGDGCRHDSHRAKVHDPDDQEDRHQTETAVAAVEAEAQAVSQGRASVGRQRTAAPGRLPTVGEVTRLPRGELEGAGHKDDHTDRDRYAARQRRLRRASASRPLPTWTRTRRSLLPRWQRRAAPRCQKKLARKPCVVRSPPRKIAQPLSYSSWRRHQKSGSLRPLGARSSHWYAPQRPSNPRAYAE